MKLVLNFNVIINPQQTCAKGCSFSPISGINVTNISSWVNRIITWPHHQLSKFNSARLRTLNHTKIVAFRLCYSDSPKLMSRPCQTLQKYINFGESNSHQSTFFKESAQHTFSTTSKFSTTDAKSYHVNLRACWMVKYNKSLICTFSYASSPNLCLKDERSGNDQHGNFVPSCVTTASIAYLVSLLDFIISTFLFAQVKNIQPQNKYNSPHKFLTNIDYWSIKKIKNLHLNELQSPSPFPLPLPEFFFNDKGNP